MENYKQLYEKTNEEYKEFYPLTDILSIIDKESGKNLKQLLNQYNHIKLDWKGNTVNTRNSVPLILRHKGLFITYDTGSNIVTEYYTGDDISASINTVWQNDNNWTNFSVAAGLADQEDITEVNGKFKFADRNHNAAQFTGMGKVILRKNLVDIGGGTVKNVLTQDMINKSNTIYEIRYDFDLNGQEITIPEGCVCDFQGGSFSNGIIKNIKSIIASPKNAIFKENISIPTVIDKGYVKWFGAKGDNKTDDTIALQKALDTFKVCIFNDGTYCVSSTLTVTSAIHLVGYNGHWLNASRLNMIGDCETLIKVDNKNVGQYINISYLRFDGSKTINVENAVYKENTIAITTANSGNCIVMKYCNIRGFQFGLVSNNNSYYNNIYNNRFENVKVIVSNFSPNNFIFTANRCLNFGAAFLDFSGDGQMVIHKNSFESFSSCIFNTKALVRNMSFCFNYVEPRNESLPALMPNNNNGKYGGNILFAGQIDNFVAIQNEYQITDSKRLYNLSYPKTFVSIGNNVMLKQNYNLERYFYVYVFDPENPLSKLILLDNYNNHPAVANYETNYTKIQNQETTSNAVVIAVDPIKGNIVESNSKRRNIKTNATLFSNDGVVSYYVQNNICYLRGSVSKLSYASVSEGDIVGTLTDFKNIIVSIGTNYTDCYVKCINKDYNEVVLKFNYEDNTLTYVSGDITKGIIYDGAFILFRM